MQEMRANLLHSYVARNKTTVTQRTVSDFVLFANHYDEQSETCHVYESEKDECETQSSGLNMPVWTHLSRVLMDTTSHSIATAEAR